MNGAKIAISTKNTMIAPPMMAEGLRRMRRRASPHRPTERSCCSRGWATAASLMASASRVADPRVDEGVAHVDDQVHEDEDERQHQHAALDDLVVASDDRLVDPASDATPREDRLGQDGAAP